MNAGHIRRVKNAGKPVSGSLSLADVNLSVKYDMKAGQLRIHVDTQGSLTKAHITVDGEQYTKGGEVTGTKQVAPVKYTKEHFHEVDVLMQQGYAKMKAIEEVTQRFDFNFSDEGFRKQYNKRHENIKVRKTGTAVPL